MSSQLTNFGDTRFWDFSLALYVKPQVAECCLKLQDEHGANVNLVLWCLWLEQRGIKLTRERLAESEALIHKWDADYVQVLRQLRRKMKSECNLDDALTNQVRERIKSTELLAEKCEQEWLENLARNWRISDEADDVSAGENLSFYLHHLNIDDALIADVKKTLDQK